MCGGNGGMVGLGDTSCGCYAGFGLVGDIRGEDWEAIVPGILE